MSFNFDKAIEEASSQVNEETIGAIVLGQSGAGKSFIMGTLPGKVLYLYTGGEAHGVKSAKVQGKHVTPVRIDYDKSAPADQRNEVGNLKPDAAYKRLLAILSDVEGIKAQGFNSIALDGATEIEQIITSTEQWKNACLSDKGKHNSYAEGKVTLAMFRPIIAAMQNLQIQLKINYAMSCILDVKAAGIYGEVEEASPRLSGDVLVVGRMSKDGEAKHKLQFMTDVTKVSKDLVGNVKKTLNFAPRIAGISVADMPPYMDADLSKVVDIKKKKK
jgi:hypothetical protein